MTPDTLDTSWYVSIDGQQQGPLHRMDVAAAYKDGRLKPSDFVWHAALGDWMTARELMAPPPAQDPPPAPLPPPAAPTPQAPAQSFPHTSPTPAAAMRVTCEGFGAWSVGAGFIEACDDAVIIDKKIAANASLAGGMMSALLSAATSSAHGHSIPYESIMSVNVSKGGWGSRPFIQIVSTGESLISDPEKAQESPSCFVVRKDALQQIIDLKDEIEKRTAAAKTSARTPGGVAGEIAKLSELLNQGFLTQNEFDAAKRKLLGI